MAGGLTVPGRQVLPSSAAPALNSTAAPLDAFGGSSRGLLQAGQQLGNLGDQLATEAIRVQQDENERVSKNLDVMFGEAIRKIQFGDGQEPGYFSAMGENALSSFDAASKALDEEMKRVAGTTTNQRALALFSRAAQVRKLSALEAMSRHREQERRVASKATSDARIEGAINDAAVNWRDEKAISLSKNTILAEIMDQAEDQGWSPDVANQKLGEAVTTMHFEAITNAFRQDPIEAQIYYTRHLDEIDGKARAKVEKLLEDSVLRTRSQELAGKYIAQFDNEADAIKAAQADLKGKTEDETVARLVAFFQLKDRELGRETARINALNAQETRAYTQEGRKAKEVAPDLAAQIVAETTSLTEALSLAREKYDGQLYSAVEDQIRTQIQGERTDTADARADFTASEDAVKRRALEQAPDRAAAIFEQFDTEVEALAEARRIYEGPSYTAVEAQLKGLYAAGERDNQRDEKKAKEKAALFAVGILDQNLSEDKALEKIADLFSGPMYDAVSQQVRQHYAAERRARNDAVKEARRDANKAIADGSTVEQWRSSNPDSYALLSEEEGAIKDLYDAAARVVEGRIYAPVSDGETLESLRKTPERDLVSVDLLSLRAKLTEEEYDDALRLQTSAQKAQERKSESRAAYSARDRAINDLMPKVRSGGVIKDALSPESKIAVQNESSRFIQEYFDRETKWPSTPEVEAEVQRLMLRIEADPDGLFNKLDLRGGATVAQRAQMTPEQIAVARVPFESIPLPFITEAQALATKYGVEYSEEWAEEVVAARALRDRPRLRALLGLSRAGGE